MTPQTKSSTKTSKQPRLSEAARHVVIPKGIVTSGWPAVRDTLANLGIIFDQWQQDLTRLTLGKRHDGTYAASVGGVVLSIPRQIGKTFWAGSLIFALCLIFPGIKVIWTAHHTDTADETFEAMQALAEQPKFKPHVRRTLTGGGKQRIIFHNKSRIEFGARESGFGRGKTKVAILVLDEFQHVSDSALENLSPTQNQGGLLTIMMGTPPRPQDRGEAFKKKRNRALSGKSKDLLFVEMSADRNARLDDHKQWAKANPSFPERTPVEAMERLLENLGSDDSFRREALGIWDEDNLTKSLISADDWSILEVEDSEIGPGLMVVGIKFSVDGEYVGLSVGVRPDSCGPVHVSGLRLASMAEGMGWITNWCRDRKDKISQIVIDGRGADAVLVRDLTEAGFRARAKVKRSSSRFIRLPSAVEYSDAHDTFLQAVRTEDMTHGISPTLDAQVEGSMRRKVGNSGGWGFQAIKDTDNSTLLDSAVLAYWGAKTCTRKRKEVSS